jgi:hypothetical protein
MNHSFTNLTPASKSAHDATAQKLASDYIRNLGNYREDCGARFPTLAFLAQDLRTRCDLREKFNRHARMLRANNCKIHWHIVQAGARAEIKAQLTTGLSGSILLQNKLTRIRAAEAAADTGGAAVEERSAPVDVGRHHLRGSQAAVVEFGLDFAGAGAEPDYRRFRGGHESATRFSTTR